MIYEIQFCIRYIFAITKLQSRQTGQAGLRFKQLLWRQATGVQTAEIKKVNQFEYERPKKIPKTDIELLNDILRVSKLLNLRKLTQKLYSQNGFYDVTT